MCLKVHKKWLVALAAQAAAGLEEAVAEQIVSWFDLGPRSRGRATARARQRATVQSEMDSEEQRAALRAAMYRRAGPSVVHLLHGAGAYDDSLNWPATVLSLPSCSA